MLHLRTLGSISLTDDEGRPLAAVLRQPKRFALLAYLALARPSGFHRRDTLLALFWPEMDAARARASLRQALYTLRRQLPAGVVDNRGEGEVGLAPGTLGSDVEAFEAAVARGDAETALTLYRGDLLPGFHVSDAAPELDRWLEDRRLELRAAAVSAAHGASARAERAGALDAALEWAVRAAALSPLDEDLTRREIELRHRAGDRPGALRVFESWARRLGEELDLAPSDATLQVVERVRREPAPVPPGADPRTPDMPASPASAAAPARSDAAGARAAGPGEGSVGWRRVARARRPRRAAGALLAAVLATTLLVALPLRLDWRESAAAPGPARLVVLPFDYRGDGDGGYLADGLAYLFSAALDGDDLRVLDAHGLVGEAGAGGEDYDRAAAAELAMDAGARYFLLGSVVETPGGLQVSASLFEPGHTLPLARSSASGTEAEVLRLVDEVAARLLTALAGASTSRVSRLGAGTGGSLEAVKAYIAGERLMREGRFTEAIGAFEEAVAADSMFALAHYRISQAASWAFQGDLASRAAAHAVRLADRLPDRERRLVAAQEAYRRGAAGEALALLQEASTLYPNEAEIWYRLGELRLHFGPLNGWPLGEAAEPFRRAVTLDSSYTEALYHLAQLATFTGDTAGALASIDRLLRVAPDGARSPQLRVLRSIVRAGEGWDARLRELATAADFTVLSSMYNAGVYAGRPDLARDLAVLLLSPDRTRESRVLGRLALAALELALGRWTAADRALAGFEPADHPLSDPGHAVLLAAPAARPTHARLAALLGRLPAPAPAAPPEEAVSRHYTRGLLAVLLGDEPLLEASLDALERSGAADHVTGLGLLAAARLATRVEPPTAAEGPRFDVRAEPAILNPVLSRPARRFLEARRLEEEGRLAEALVWYASLESFSVHDLVWGVPALLNRARIHEQLGEAERAIALYRRFAALWAGADDPALRELALARLAALGSRPAPGRGSR